MRHVAETALSSGVSPILIVTGHARECVETALDGLELRFVHNADYASGLSTSLRVGVTALSGVASGVLVMLGDMPKVRNSTLRRLVAAHVDATSDIIALVPTFARQWGNPVLLRSEGLVRVRALEGDKGARALLRAFRTGVVEIPVDDQNVLADVDQQEDLVKLGA